MPIPTDHYRAPSRPRGSPNNGDIGKFFGVLIGPEALYLDVIRSLWGLNVAIIPTPPSTRVPSTCLSRMTLSFVVERMTRHACVARIMSLLVAMALETDLPPRYAPLVRFVTVDTGGHDMS